MPSSTSSNITSIPSLALLLAVFLWASSFIALKIAFIAYNPMVVIFGRMLIATICFLIISRRLTQSLHYCRGDYKLIIAMAVCEPCLYFIFEAKAVQNTTASQAGMITALGPILVMAGAALFLKEKIKAGSWLGSIIAIIGVCWLSLAGSPSKDAPDPLLGNFLEFLAMICAAGYTLIAKSLIARYSPFFLTAMQAFIGCLFYFPLLFLPTTVLPDQLHQGPAMAIVYLGAVVTLGAYGLFNYGMKYLPANQAVSYVNLIPIFAVLLGWLILGDTFNGLQLCAGVLIIGGVYLTQGGSWHIEFFKRRNQ